MNVVGWLSIIMGYIHISFCFEPKALSKTLAERQAEYEQARLRILGSAKNEEDDEEIKR